MIFHENRLMIYHALFVLFEKTAGGALGVKKSQVAQSEQVISQSMLIKTF